MKYILANEWLRNIFLWVIILLTLHLTEPQNLTTKDYFPAGCFFLLIYVASWLNNRMLFYCLNNQRVFLFFHNRSNLGAYFIFLFPLLTAMVYVEHWTFEHLTLSDTAKWSLTDSISACCMFLLVGFGINSAYREIMRRQTALETELLAKRNELRFLQNQVNPHFLFNSLNNLYSASIVEPEKVSERILQMAELLRYQLSCNKRELVPLEEEVDFLLNYLDVEKRRLGRQVLLTVETSGDFRKRDITPLLFLPFLENAFKYSTGGTGPARVEVQITAAPGEISFFVKNTLPDQTAPPPASTGIGIENARKRLDLLYPHQYDLSIHPEMETFSVNLTIRFSA